MIARRLILALLAALAALAPAAQAAPHVVGVASRVFDGDSFLLRMDGGAVIEVRLAGIDAPERDQPHADEARAALRQLVLGRRLRLQVVDQDRYGRQVAVAHLEGEAREVNAELVRLGHAWVYGSGARGAYRADAALLALQDEARAARRGLWALAESERIPPWRWRRSHPSTKTSGTQNVDSPVASMSR